MFLPPPE